jgi:probable rRNA maturation factor
MEITIKNLQRKINLNPTQITKIVKTILKHEGVKKTTLSLVFVSNQKIKVLNKKYLKRDHATDVLAFDLTDRAHQKKKTSEVTADIFISTDSAIQNSKKYRTNLDEEIVLYVIHGILHLLGYDDHDPQKTKKMRNKERKLLDFLRPRIKSILKKG